MTRPTAFIVEPDACGHRLYYVALILDQCHKRDVAATLVTTESAATSAEFDAHLGHIASLDVRTVDGVDKSRRRFASHDAALSAALALRSADDWILLPDLEPMLVTMVRHRPSRLRNLAGLLLRPVPSVPSSVIGGLRDRVGIRCASSAVARRLLVCYAKRAGRVHVLELADAVAADPVARTPGVVAIPDPVHRMRERSQLEARAELGLPDGDLAVVVGHIDRRKGLDLILDAFVSNEEGDLPRLVIAGRISPAFAADGRLRALVASGTAIVRDQYLSAHNFECYLQAADVILVVREEDDGPSGILGQAVAAGRPVVTAGSDRLGSAVRDRDLGMWSRPDPAALIDAIRHVLCHQTEFARAMTDGREAVIGSEQRFADAFLDPIVERLARHR